MDFDFNQTLKRAMNGKNIDQRDSDHLDSMIIDTKMMNLMENNIKSHATIEALLKKMQLLNYSIDKGGK